MKPIYKTIQGSEWILARCTLCSRTNYCEQHGTTAPCKCAGGKWVEHESIPFNQRTWSGLQYIGSDKMKTKACFYHSELWEALVEAGWFTISVDLAGWALMGNQK